MASMLQNKNPARRLFVGEPNRSPIDPWLDELEPMVPVTPHRASLDYDYTKAQLRLQLVRHGVRDLAGFSMPQRFTVMGREHDFVEFRTPQHPLHGTNNWGGDSPLLLGNIPKESLETDYLKFNPLVIEGDYVEIKDGVDVKRRKRDWGFGKFGWRKKKEVLGLVEEKKRRGWIFGVKLNRRWPQGW